MNEQRWVTRSVSHTIEHLVVAEEGGMLFTNCAQRMRVKLAQPVKNSRGEIYRCQACAHGASLLAEEGTAERVAVR